MERPQNPSEHDFGETEADSQMGIVHEAQLAKDPSQARLAWTSERRRLADVQDGLALGSNTRAVLALGATGATALGLLYGLEHAADSRSASPLPTPASAPSTQSEPSIPKALPAKRNAPIASRASRASAPAARESQPAASAPKPPASAASEAHVSLTPDYRVKAKGAALEPLEITSITLGT